MRDDTPVELDLARPRAGAVEPWVRWAVVLAVAATLAVVVVGPRVIRERDAYSLDVSRFWFENALALGLAAILALACLPGGRASRFVRLAVVLPVAQVAALLATWLAWLVLAGRLPISRETTPLFDLLPVRVVLPWLAFAIGLGGWAVARRRRREALHATLMLALVFLLLLGLWLPIASAHWNEPGWIAWNGIERALRSPADTVAFVVVPPFAAALGFTATALRWPHVWRRFGVLVIALLALGLLIAIECRLDIAEAGAYVYVNFLHVLAAAAVVAVGALVVLGAALWIANARGRRALERGALVGTIAGRDPVARFELTSWLRGHRATAAAFTVETAYGEVPVPAGARVIAPTPLATTLLHRGEVVTTLRGGDRVALGGFVRAPGDGPFRDTSAPIPGADGVTVRRSGDEPYGFSHVALELWRPALAYLVICVAVALPGLAALLSSQL